MSQTRISRILLLLVAIFIAYGSLYPLHFKAPPPGMDSIGWLFDQFSLFSSRGDILGNIALFFPYGFLLVPAAPAARKKSVFIVAMVAGGVIFAALLQWAQIYIPARTAALGDVVWNTTGALLGLMVAWVSFKSRWAYALHLDYTRSIPAGLLVFWLLGQWLPLVPSIDFQHVKDAVKPLFEEPGFDFGAMLIPAAGILAAAGLVQALTKKQLARWIVPFAMLAVLGGKPFIVTQVIDWPTVAGFTMGYLAWLLFSFATQRNQLVLTWFAIVLAWSGGTLSPLEFSGDSHPFNWAPFAALLEGSMLLNAKSIAQWMFLYAATIWLARDLGARTIPMSIGLALWVACLEAFQTQLAGHSPDITQPLLVVLAGLVLKQFASALRQRRATPLPTAPSPEPFSLPSQPYRPLLIWLSAAAAIAIPLWLALKLPGVPYNVRELFLGGGNILAVWLFAVTLFWLGAGSVIFGWKLRASRFPMIAVFQWGITISLVCLMLLYTSVTPESIADIAGSTNVYWFVVNQDMWGPAWRHFFLSFPSEALVAVVERCVRFAALIGPLMLSLAIFVSAHAYAEHGFLNSAKKTLWLLASALPYFLLCKIIAFDWSSTDNLNELIAREGAWGMGGGFYLYLLLALITANAALLANACRKPAACSIAVALTVALLPLGWLILGSGLEQSVEKYDHVFSGQQFLLGPDRTHLLSEAQLFVRWAVLQAGAVVILAAGVRLGQLTLTSLGKPVK